MFFKRIFFLIFLLITISCRNSKTSFSEIDIVYEENQMLFIKETERFTGLVLEYYNDKQPKAEINIIDGLKDGIFRQYYENGELQVESKFKKGKLVGKFKAFHENGNEQIITFYKENLRMGSFEEFYDNKKLKLCGNYFKGIKIGQFEEYFKSGGKAIYNY